ncbi:LysR family transcriptional regulator (fragment) [Sinorhizobium medicae]|uniref:LysR family transcriptional regulator n=1 Tax=Sinorhizobium medicae TaxID=110321 RepID=A0A508X6J6_9HYPH
MEGALTVNDGDLLISAAAGDQALANIFEDHVYGLLASGRLVRCLEDWCPFPGYYVYYPDRKQKTPALAALIAAAIKRPNHPPHSDEHQHGRSPA